MATCWTTLRVYSFMLFRLKLCSFLFVYLPFFLFSLYSFFSYQNGHSYCNAPESFRFNRMRPFELNYSMVTLIIFSIRTFPEHGKYGLNNSFVLLFRFFELAAFWLASLLYILPIQLCIANHP